MKTLAPLAIAALAITFGAACEPVQDGPDASAYTNALPDQRILVTLPTDEGNRAIGETAEGYVWTRDATRDVNGLISFVLTTVDTITDFEPTFSTDDNEFFWGPWNDGGLDPNESALYVRLDEATGIYGWAIIQRPKESTSDDDWVPVVLGEATPGDTEDAGSGTFAIDFDAINTLDPTETTVGVFATSYTYTPEGVSAEAAFQNFAEDGDPVLRDALYVYEQDAAGSGSMDLAVTEDAEEGAALETIVLRTRWMADGQGRGDMVIFGGDLGELIVTGSQCWDTSFNSIYEATNLFDEEGDEAACAFDVAEWNDDAPAVEES